MVLLDINVQHATEDQLPQLLELDQLCFGGLWSLDNYQWELDHPESVLITLSSPNYSYLIGVGCFWSILEEAHITLLAIHPDHQGKGLGKFLLSSLLKEAIKLSLERATLEVKASNEIALSLYQKFGFQIAGRRKGYYQDGEDGLVLWCSGLNQPEFSQFLDQ
jgi:[ribosomal protein S18]-alanine N-acetyltransferase